MNKQLTVIKALLLGLEINFSGKLIKLGKPNDSIPIFVDVGKVGYAKLHYYHILQKFYNETFQQDEWTIVYEFGFDDILDLIDKLSDEEVAIIAANVVLNLYK